MDAASCERVERLVGALGHRAVALRVLERVRGVVGPVLPQSLEVLDRAAALDWSGDARSAFLGDLPEQVDRWMGETEHFDAALLVGQVAGLLDPRLVSPGTAIAAAIEAAALLHSVVESGVQDAALQGAWEQETLDSLESWAASG
jgi:hypothetical protein